MKAILMAAGISAFAFCNMAFAGSSASKGSRVVVQVKKVNPNTGQTKSRTYSKTTRAQRR